MFIPHEASWLENMVVVHYTIRIYVYIAAFRNLPSPAQFAHDNTTIRDFINTAHLVANSNLHFLTSLKPPRISKYDVGGKL